MLQIQLLSETLEEEASRLTAEIVQETQDRIHVRHIDIDIDIVDIDIDYILCQLTP